MIACCRRLEHPLPTSFVIKMFILKRLPHAYNSMNETPRLDHATDLCELFHLSWSRALSIAFEEWLYEKYSFM